MRIRDPKTTALVFSSGKMVVTGAKSETQSEDAARKFSEIIRKIGFSVSAQKLLHLGFHFPPPKYSLDTAYFFLFLFRLIIFYLYVVVNGVQVKLHEFKIQNMVGSCDVGFAVNLHDLHISEHSKFCTVQIPHPHPHTSIDSLVYTPESNFCLEIFRFYLLTLLPTLSLPLLQYEPELFPGLIYRKAEPKVVLLIFVSGKLVVTGAKVSHRRACRARGRRWKWKWKGARKREREKKKTK